MAAPDPDGPTPIEIDPDFETSLVASLLGAFADERVFVAESLGAWPEVRGGGATRGFKIYVVGHSGTGKALDLKLGKRGARDTQLEAGQWIIDFKSSGKEVRASPATVARLTAAVREALTSTAQGSGLNFVFDPAVFAIAEVVSRRLARTRQQISEHTIEKLVDAFAETHDPVAQLNAEIDADNAQARVRFMNNFLTLTSEEVTTAAGSSAKNRSQTASRWKSEGKIFSVPWQGSERYPAFQFKDGRPLPIIAKLLAALPSVMTSWEIAFWFVSANSWLDGAAPRAKLLHEEKILEAARKEGEAIFG